MPESRARQRVEPTPHGAFKFSPFRYTVAITCAGYVLLVFFTWLGISRSYLGLNAFLAAVVDTTIFVIGMLPLLYFLMFRPMQHYVAQRERAMRALEQANTELETRVEERTRELAHASRDVQESLETLEEAYRKALCWAN